MNDLYYYSFTLLALAGVILNIHKNSYGFLCWMISNLAFTIQSFILGAYNMTLLFAAQFLLSCWGLYSWR